MLGYLMPRIRLMFRRFAGQSSHWQAPPQAAGPHALLETDKWAASDHVLRLAKIVGVRPYPLDELMLMAAAFEFHRPRTVIDIGTHHGKSARIWWELSQALQAETVIHTIDLADPKHAEFPGAELGQFIRGLPIHQHLGDGYECARQLLELGAEQPVLLFLDGDHGYRTVIRELGLLLLIRRGCALLHDTMWQPLSSYNHGPYLALQEYLEQHPNQSVQHAHFGLPGMSYLSLGRDDARD